MKKITFLLTFLLTAVVGMWAQPAGTTLMTGETLETGYYYIYNNGAAKYLSGSTNAYAWLDETALTDQVGLWYIQNLGAGNDGNIRYYVQVSGSNYYLASLGPTAPIGTNKYYLRISVRENGAYYTISGHQDNHPGYDPKNQVGNKDAIQWTGSGNNLNRGGGTITNTSFGENAQWVLYKVVNATYTVSVVGTTDSNAGVQFGGNSYANGATFSASTDITAADFTAIAVDGYVASVTINGTTVVVNYLEEKYAVDLTDLYVTNLSVAPTTDPIVEGQWYILTQLRGGESPAYDRGANSVMYRAATSVTANTLLVTNTPANDIKKYLFRFFSAGVGNGYYVQTGLGNFWEDGTLYGQNHKVQAVSNVSSAGFYLAYNATQSADGSTGWAFNSTADGVTYGNKLDNNGAGNTLSFWGTGQTTSDENNVWKLYPVELGALISNVSNITINVLKGSDIVKTVTMEDVAEGREINVAEALGHVGFVSSYDPATITATAEDQTVNVTYTSSLPFTLAADPTSTDAPAYLMTLRTRYAHGSATTSTYDITDDYLWTFGGDEFNGVTVYNKGNGYMSVGSAADNSEATFSTTPTAFTIKPNNKQANGFNLNIPGTNAYINLRGNNVSTWLDTRGNGDEGSCLKVYSVDEVVGSLVKALEPYFSGCVGGITLADYSDLHDKYTALLATPTKQGYYDLVDDIDNALASRKIEFVDGGYYWIQNYACAYKGTSRGGEADPNGHFMTVNSSKTAPSCTKVSTTMEDNYGLWKISSGTTSGKYVIQNARTGKYIASQTSLSDLPVEFNLEALNGYQYRIGTGNAEDYSNICDGHNSDLVGWSVTVGGDGAWLLIPVEIEEITLIAPTGVAEGEEVIQSFANATDAQLPTSIGVFTITEDLAAGAHLDTIASGKIAAGQGYLISGVKGATVPLLPVASAVEAPVGNLLVAGEGSVVNGGYILAYKKGDTEAKFYQINGLTVPENRSYLPEGTPTRGLEFLFGGLGDDVTGINGITTGAENGAIYDLQGRRVNNAQKGVYIINGKKVIK